MSAERDRAGAEHGAVSDRSEISACRGASDSREISDRSIISMERLHEIVNGGGLAALSTDGVVDGAGIGEGCPPGSYTCWILQYQSGYRCSLYTLN